MSESILKSTKKSLDIPEDYNVFDGNIIMHINSVFSTLNQLGIGPIDGFEIENDSANWDDFLGGNVRFNFVKSYMHLRVKMMFDPPGTSFLLESLKEQKDEFEVRISYLRESGMWLPASPDLDGGNAFGSG